MTEDSNAAAGRAENATANVDATVGADQIDAYLNSVECVLLTAKVPNGERFQILADLELQISEMLAPQPLPLSEETVRDVLATLEPPSHFATIYSSEIQSPSPAAVAGPITYNRSAVVAAGSCALIALSCLLLIVLAAGHAVGPAVKFVLLLLSAGSIVTPFALRRAFRELRAEPLRYRGRDLAIASMTAYATIVPLLVLAFASAITDGYVLFPLAVASFIGFQWLLIRRLRQRLVAAIPSEPAADPLPNEFWRFIRPTPANPCTG